MSELSGKMRHGRGKNKERFFARVPPGAGGRSATFRSLQRESDRGGKHFTSFGQSDAEAA